MVSVHTRFFQKMRNCISKQKILQVLLQVCKPSQHVLCFPIKNVWLYFLSDDNLLLCGNIFQWIALLLSSLSFLQQASMLMFSIHSFLGWYMPKLSWNISFILIALDLTVDWVKNGFEPASDPVWAGLAEWLLCQILVTIRYLVEVWM